MIEKTVEVPALWTPAEAARYLHTTEGGLKRLRYRGVGPTYLKAGTRVLYRVEDVLAWLQERKGAA